MKSKKLVLLLGGLSIAAVGCLAACSPSEPEAHEHSYNTDGIVWEWNTDHTRASATISCNSCEEGVEGHTLNATATGSAITETIIKQAELNVAGEKTYTATVVIDGVTYTDTSESVSFKYEVVVPTLAPVVYNGSIQTATVAEDAPYTIKTNADNAVNAGTYQVVLELKDAINNKWVGTDGATVTVDFVIVKADNSVSEPVVADIKHGEPPAPSATAAFGDITYVYSATADGEYGEVADFTCGTWYVKAVATGNDNYGPATSDAVSFNVNHNYNVLDDSDAEYDYLKCACGEAQPKEGDYYAFKKTLTSTEPFEAVAGGFTATGKFSVSLDGVSAYVSVEKAYYGEYGFGTVLSELTIPAALSEDTQNHGLQNITVEVKDSAGYTHKISVPVLFITERIDNSSDFKKLEYSAETPVIYGYYVLDANLDITGAENLSGASAWDKAKGFRGTLDGNGHTIKAQSFSFGIFGLIGEGAVIKNVTIQDAWLKGDGYISLLAKAIYGATFENCTFTAIAGSANSVAQAWIAFGEVASTSFKNCTINAGDFGISTLFGDVYWGQEGNGHTACTFENVEVRAKSFGYVGRNKKIAPDGTLRTDESEIDTANCKIWYVTDCNGIAVYKEDAIETKQDIALKNAEASLELGAAYENATLTSLRLNDRELTATIEGSTLKIATNQFTEADVVDEANLVAVVSVEGCTVTLTIPVAIVTAKTLTEVTFESSQDVVLSNETVALSLDNGITDYATEGTIAGIACGTYNLGTNPAALDVTELKSATQQHGVTSIIVTINKTENDVIKITIPVLLVTKEISQISELYEITARSDANPVMFGYYRLTDNIGDATVDMTGAGKYFWSGEQGFRGTLDGNGRTISFKALAWTGLFGTLGDGAVVKNVTLSYAWATAGGGTNVLGATMYAATLDNVTIRIEGGNAAVPGDSSGLIVGCVVANTAKFNNCAFYFKWANIFTVFGNKFNYADGMFTNCTLTVSKGNQLTGIGYNADTQIVYAADGSYGTTTEELKNCVVSEKQGDIKGLTIDRP